MFRAFYVTAALTIAAPATAHAASASMQPTAAKIIAAMQITKQLDSMFESLTPVMATAIIADSSNGIRNPMLDPYRNRPGGIEGLTKILSDELLISLRNRYDKLGRIYESHLLTNMTDSELNEAAAFAQSPTGQKLLSMGNDIEKKIEQQAGIVGMEAASEAMPRAFERGAKEVLQ